MDPAHTGGDLLQFTHPFALFPWCSWLTGQACVSLGMMGKGSGFQFSESIAVHKAGGSGGFHLSMVINALKNMITSRSKINVKYEDKTAGPAWMGLHVGTY